MTEPFEEGVRPPGVGFSPDRYPWKDDLKKAIDDLKVKKMQIDRYWRYYEGDHPPLWLNKAIKEMFEENEELAYDMVENWCDVAVDEPLMRCRVDGFDGETEVDAKAAQNVWDDNDMDLDQRDLYRHVRIAGESFLFLWEDDDKEFGFDMSIVDPREVYWPDNVHRTEPMFTARVWLDADTNVWRATLYYAVDVIRLVGPDEAQRSADAKAASNSTPLIPEPDAFTLDPENEGGEHGFENVPVVRFAPTKKRISPLKNIIPIQNRINKLVAQGVVNGEYNAYRKLIILTQQAIEEGDLRVRPNRALVLDPGGDVTSGAAPTSIWEGSASELSNFDDSVGRQVEKLFSKVPLPRHLLVQSGTLISGDAQEMDEGPFLELVGDMNDYFGASWEDVYALMEIEAKPTWRNPAIKSDKAEMETVKLAKDAGVPLELALKKYGSWTTEELKELEERELSPAEMAQAMNTVGTGVALGSVDPEQAKQLTSKIIGGKPNVATATPKPPVQGAPPVAGNPGRPPQLG